MNSLSSSLNARISLDRSGGLRTGSHHKKIPNSDVLGELYGEEFDHIDFGGRYLSAQVDGTLF